MNKIKVGCFVTENSPYVQVAEEYLIPSCQKLNLNYEVVHSTKWQSWQRNVAEKPAVIVAMLMGLREDEVLLFLDADCRIMKYPQLAEEFESDFGYYELSWNSHYGYTQVPDTKEILSGTLLIKSNERTIKFCQDWYNHAIKNSEWEQKILQKLLMQKHDLKTEVLPIEYCYIETRPGGLPNLISCDPVIVHYQVSRKLKKVMNGRA